MNLNWDTDFKHKFIDTSLIESALRHSNFDARYWMGQKVGKNAIIGIAAVKDNLSLQTYSLQMTLVFNTDYSESLIRNLVDIIKIEKSESTPLYPSETSILHRF